MIRRAFFVSLVLLGCGGNDGASTTEPVADETGTTTDTGASETSTGADTGTSTSDTGTSTTDTGTVGDTGTPPPGDAPSIGPCRIFPPDNPWNTPIDKAPLHKDSAALIAAMAPTRGLHPDWGNWSTDHYGIPWQTGTGATPVKMTWTETWGAAESDKLPCTGSQWCYPIPSTVKIEGGPGASSGSDRHVLYLDTAGAPNNCTLYELYNTQNWTGPGWTAINGAIFHLGTNALRPEGWTSADAAGLPILPGLVRLSEVKAGAIKHAIRFTMASTANLYIHPATHAAGSGGIPRPPMGLRVRLKASYAIPGTASAETKVILQAMKTYGLMLADNGSDWYISGDSDDGWNPLMDKLLSGLGAVKGGDFEVVDSGPSITPPP